MELKLLALYTVDSKDGKILELNPLQDSGIKTLHKAHDGNFIRNVVSPHVQLSLPDREVIQPACGRSFDSALEDELESYPEDWEGVLIPEAQLGTIAIAEHRKGPLHIANADRKLVSLFRHKGLQFDIATQIPGQSIPRTRNYDPGGMGGISALTRQIREDFEGIEKLVVKPVDQLQGEGIVIIDMPDLERELQYLLTRSMFSDTAEDHFGDGKFAEKYWRENVGSMLQVQEFLQDRPIRHKGRQWDATRRYAAATIVTENDAGEIKAQTSILGGFAKLPRHPIPEDGSVTLNNRISYSKSHSLTEGLTHFFRRVTYGNGDRILLSAGEIKADTAEMQKDLDRLFTKIEQMDIVDYASELKESNDPARRRLSGSISGWIDLDQPSQEQDNKAEPDAPDNPSAG